MSATSDTLIAAIRSEITSTSARQNVGIELERVLAPLVTALEAEIVVIETP